MRNGFFGVKNAHIAPMEDEAALTYATPVHIPGIVAISMEPAVNTATSYADNEPWLDKQQDNGGSGTISFYDTESTPELRALIADLAGYTLAPDGRTILEADKQQKYFAFMCEQPGEVVSKRRCLLKCQISKPKQSLNTNQDTPEITQLDYDFTWRPVKLPGGIDAPRVSGYDSYSDLEGWDAFFDEVDVENLLKEPAAPGGGQQGGGE